MLSDFFGVTVDKLLGVNETIEREKVAQYLSRFQEAISRGKVYDSIAIVREGVAEYPNNFALLNKLMFALFVSGDSSGNIPEWRENQRKNDAEITALGERIMKYCPDQDIRLEATAKLAFNHCEMGRKEIGRAIYESLPSIKCCKENQIWWGLDDGGPTPDDWGAAKLQLDIAKRYARLGNDSAVIDHLLLGARAAKAFDQHPEEQTFSCMLLGDVTVKQVDFATSDTRTLCEIMRE